VFLLDATTSRRLLAECRSTTIWPPLDAIQISELRFGYNQNPFTLERVDDQWRLAGKKEEKINGDAVRETLAALAGLRAERYVLDKAADLPLYGLQPPELALRIKTPTGARTLNIGRQEGNSKRYYAIVAGSDNAPVFTLSESDSQRIVRTLKAFRAKE
jgi:hypothetical protein